MGAFHEMIILQQVEQNIDQVKLLTVKPRLLLTPQCSLTQLMKWKKPPKERKGMSFAFSI